MGRWHPKRCKVCGGTDANGFVSARGYCIEHGLARMEANNVQISEHRGPWFEYWRQRTILAFGGALVVDDPPNGR